jgi:hypothetical protein
MKNEIESQMYEILKRADIDNSDLMRDVEDLMQSFYEFSSYYGELSEKILLTGSNFLETYQNHLIENGVDVGREKAALNRFFDVFISSKEKFDDLSDKIELFKCFEQSS